ncbi:DUF1236 domain-containing protein [Shinella zoogloeoides]|uniref:DUF1236 domain-containing protein n=1 Tax=Shinella zoogloeoides TaxID=352475 RepID=UPI00299D9DFC|nr:DUF1236 domain-containing protein [Shinella zoogloeoides]WPE18938.1 hypothetical protein ShzoTeo12_00910 [Shinella zoogloeoides]
MRKILMAGAALALLGATAAHADDRDKEALGGAAGGAAGAAAGAVVGGPIGAVVGGVAGFAIGADAAVPDDARVYVMENPTPPVVLEAPVTAETRFDDSVTLTPIPEHPDLAYVYVDNRPVIVRTDSRQVIYAPDVQATGSISSDIPEATITYVERHPVDPVILEGPVEAGMVVPDTVQIVDVPENPNYGYIYVDQRPVLVDRGSRQVIWVR